MITAYKPELKDLWFRQEMLSDAKTMSYNHAYGGTIDFTGDKWDAWYERWISGAGTGRYYRYLMDASGRFIGEMAYHYDENAGVYMADVLIYSKYRGLGYGGFALDMLCSAARENGIRELYDEIASDNPAVSLFKDHRFETYECRENSVLLKKELNHHV